MEPVTIIIETPKGCGHKYDYEPELKGFKLKKILPAGLVFPFDFGFIPDTKGGDGDPLDVIVLSEITTFTGCYMECRIIGVLKAKQTERNGKTMRNDRYLAVPDVTQLFADVNEIDDLPEAIMNQLEHFFRNYNEQAGKQFEVIERGNANMARQMIADSKTK